MGVLSACREEIGTLFGYSAENRGVGITGGVDFVEMDGPVVVLSLKVCEVTFWQSLLFSSKILTRHGFVWFYLVIRVDFGISVQPF